MHIVCLRSPLPEHIWIHEHKLILTRSIFSFLVTSSAENTFLKPLNVWQTERHTSASFKFPWSVDTSESEAQTRQSLKFTNQAISSVVSGNLALDICVIKGTVPKLSALCGATVCRLSTGQPQSASLWVLPRKIPPRLAKRTKNGL